MVASSKPLGLARGRPTNPISPHDRDQCGGWRCPLKQAADACAVDPDVGAELAAESDRATAAFGLLPSFVQGRIDALGPCCCGSTFEARRSIE
jgi:hypothetical protein